MILVDIRLSRLLTGVLVGAVPAVMRGLFRNPLADPGIVGLGSRGRLGAVLAIVPKGLQPFAAAPGAHRIPAAAFPGGRLTRPPLSRISTRAGHTEGATTLFAGIALGALSGFATGELASLAGSCARRATAAPVMLSALLIAPFLARAHKVVALGEGAGDPDGGLGRGGGAISDGIGSIPVVVPHLPRLVIGRDHRFLLPAAGLLGALVRRNSDRKVRAIGTPAERPGGIGTSIVCGPVFLRILLHRRDRVDPRC